MDNETPSFLSNLINFLIADAREWCNGRMWFLRVPVWLWLAYIGVNQFMDPVMYTSLFGGINLGIHEGGHLLFAFFGRFICVAGGTIAQLSAPVISMWIFFKQRDYFGISVCFGWLSTNLIGVGVYMADAQDMVLPLVTVGGSSENQVVGHDWRYLFTKLGVLGEDKTIGFLTRGLGSCALIFALVSGAWLIWEMYRSDGKRKLVV